MDFKSIWIFLFIVIFNDAILTTILACESSSNVPQSTEKVNENQQRDIVKKHNEYRDLVRQGKAMAKGGKLPKAKNMKDLKWHDGLSKTAQQLTDLCVFDHVQYDVKPFGGVGQNLYTQYSSSPMKKCNFDGAIRSWYDEIQDFSKSQINPFKVTNGPVVGHFTQVIWADTTHVGCGCTIYKDQNDQRLPYKQIIACNYGPAGNMIGGQVYQT